MRLTKTLLGLAAISFAAMAAAQDAAAPARTPSGPAAPAPAQQHGLSGLENTVNQLQDTPPPAADAQAPTPAPAPRRRPRFTVRPTTDTPATAASPARTRRPRTVEQPAAQAPAATPTQGTATPAPAPAAEVVAPAQRPRRIVPAAQVAEEEHAAFEAALQRGRLLGAIARAGQVGTQDMLAHVSNPDSAGISGWIAVPEGNAVTVIFYAAAANGAPPRSVYRVSIVGGRVTGRQTFLTGNQPPLGPHEARMAAARAATDAIDHHPCGGDDFNVFVVPPAAPNAPIDVYQLSPQSQRGHFPLGGHFKSTIAPDGHVVASTVLAATCGDLAVPEAAAGQAAHPLTITDEADPLPTELHVFLSIWTNRPLVVAAGDPRRRFAVTSDGISPVRP